MRIGEIAKKLNCTVETIRYYEKIGLIPASMRDQNNNYRHYNQNHLDRLSFVRHCRALAMSHEEILQLLSAREKDGASCESINQVIDNHLQHVSDRIHQLQQLETQLLTLRKQCQIPGNSQSCGIIQELDSPIDPATAIVDQNNHVSGSH